MTATRRYTQRARAASQARTRDSIIDATLALWGEVGPAAVTISAVARRANVQRLTVYRHFENEAMLAAAAWRAFLQRHPLPHPVIRADIAGPAKQLRRTLRQVYAFYREAGPVLANVLQDAGRVAGLAGARTDLQTWRERVVSTAEAGWRPRGGKRNARLPAAMLALAVHHSTWISLSAAGLDERAAARVVVRSLRGVARSAQ